MYLWYSELQRRLAEVQERPRQLRDYNNDCVVNAG